MIKTQAVQHDHSWSERRVSNVWVCIPSKQEISNIARCSETEFYIVTSHENYALLGYYAAINGKK
jgi:hypothetical protein